MDQEKQDRRKSRTDSVCPTFSRRLGERSAHSTIGLRFVPRFPPRVSGMTE